MAKVEFNWIFAEWKHVLTAERQQLSDILSFSLYTVKTFYSSVKYKESISMSSWWLTQMCFIIRVLCYLFQSISLSNEDISVNIFRPNVVFFVSFSPDLMLFFNVFAPLFLYSLSLFTLFPFSICLTSCLFATSVFPFSASQITTSNFLSISSIFPSLAYFFSYCFLFPNIFLLQSD